MYKGICDHLPRPPTTVASALNKRDVESRRNVCCLKKTATSNNAAVHGLVGFEIVQAGATLLEVRQGVCDTVLLIAPAREEVRQTWFASWQKS